MALTIIPIFQKIRTGIDKVDQVIEKLYTTLTALSKVEIINGRIIASTIIISGRENAVPHKLGRVPQGYVVISKNADTNIWNATSDDLNLYLHCSTNVFVVLWVF